MVGQLFDSGVLKKVSSDLTLNLGLDEFNSLDFGKNLDQVIMLLFSIVNDIKEFLIELDVYNLIINPNRSCFSNKMSLSETFGLVTNIEVFYHSFSYYFVRQQA